MKFKEYSKVKIKKAALKYLKNIQDRHSKVDNIKYEHIETQPYLKSPKFSTDEKQLLFKLRTRMTDVKCNFESMFDDNTECNLCNEGKPQTDSHLLDCTKIIQNCPDLANNYTSNMNISLVTVKVN